MGWDPPAVGVFALCSLVELLAEPLWVLAQAHQHTSLRVRTCSVCGGVGSMCLTLAHSPQVMAKGAGQVLKVLLVLLGIAAWPQLGLLIFCAGQVRCLPPHPLTATAALTLNHCLLPLQIASTAVYVSVHYVYFWRVMSRGSAARDLPAASLRGLLPRRAQQVRICNAPSPMSGMNGLRPSISELFQPSAGGAGMELLQAVLPEADFD